jgi:hypothetical protein
MYHAPLIYLLKLYRTLLTPLLIVLYSIYNCTCVLLSLWLTIDHIHDRNT